MPPIAQHVAQSVVDALLRQPSGLPSTREIMQGLANWFRSHNTDELTWPWLGSPDSTPWRVVAAELLFRRDPTDAKLGWPAVLRAFPDPKTTIDNAAILKRLTATRPDRGANVASAAHQLAKAGEPTTWEELSAAPSSQSLAKLAFTAGTPHASHRAHSWSVANCCTLHRYAGGSRKQNNRRPSCHRPPCRWATSNG